MTEITNPIALADQHEAAERDAARHLADLARATGGQTRANRVGPWLAAQVRKVYDDLADGELYICDHVASGPVAMLACLWRPEIVVCDRCAPELLLAACADDEACDRCHTTTAPIRSTAIASGPLILAYALCQPCQAHETRQTTRRRPHIPRQPKR